MFSFIVLQRIWLFHNFVMPKGRWDEVIAPKVRATAKTGADYHTRPDSQNIVTL